MADTIWPDEIESLKKKSNKTKKDIDAKLSIENLTETIANTKEEIKTLTETMTNKVVEAEAQLQFAAEFATKEIIAKNVGHLQEIIDDKPVYQIFETENGAKLLRTEGTEQRERLTALGLFFKYAIAEPGVGNSGGQHLHLHGQGAEMVRNFLR